MSSLHKPHVVRAIKRKSANIKKMLMTGSRSNVAAHYRELRKGVASIRARRAGLMKTRN